MKKFYISAIAAMVSVASFAQSKQDAVIKANDVIANPVMGLMMADTPTDTLVGPISSTCNDSATFYTASSNGQFAGFVTGTNLYGDKEKAQEVNQGGQGLLVEQILVLNAFSYDSIGGDFHGKVYASVNGAPGTLLGTSSAVNISNIIADNFSIFNFSTPVFANGPFFISQEVENGGDWVAIYSTKGDDCAGGTSYEKWSDDTWNSLFDAWQGADLTLYMFAVVDGSTVGLGDNVISKQEAYVFPTPAAQEAYLTYDNTVATEVAINIVDINGRVVYSVNETQTEGRQVIKLNTAEFAAGTYFFNVVSANNTFNGTFSVK